MTSADLLSLLPVPNRFQETEHALPVAIDWNSIGRDRVVLRSHCPQVQAELKTGIETEWIIWINRFKTNQLEGVIDAS